MTSQHNDLGTSNENTSNGGFHKLVQEAREELIKLHKTLSNEHERYIEAENQRDLALVHLLSFDESFGDRPTPDSIAADLGTTPEEVRAMHKSGQSLS